MSTRENIRLIARTPLAHYMYGDALVGFGMVLGGYGCFNGPHDGYADRSNSKTSLPTDSRTVLPRAVG